MRQGVLSDEYIIRTHPEFFPPSALKKRQRIRDFKIPFLSNSTVLSSMGETTMVGSSRATEEASDPTPATQKIEVKEEETEEEELEVDEDSLRAMLYQTAQSHQPQTRSQSSQTGPSKSHFFQDDLDLFIPRVRDKY